MRGSGQPCLRAFRARGGVRGGEIPGAVHEKGGCLTEGTGSKTPQHQSLLPWGVGLAPRSRLPKDRHSGTGRARFRSSVEEIRVKCWVRLRFDVSK